MQVSDPTAVLSQVAPTFSDAQAVALLETHWGLEATVRPLVSERDQNFRVTTTDGRRFVFKIANAAEDPAVTDFQIQALLHIEAQKRVLDIPVETPAVQRTVAGDSSLVVTSPAGDHVARLVTFLAGTPLAERLPSAQLARNLGRSLAQLGRALAGFAHPGSGQSLLWDMQQALNLRSLVQYVIEPQTVAAVTDALDDFERHVTPVLSGMRAQVIHSDLNPDNVVIDGADPDRVVGVIDFGDMLHAPLIVDVGIGCSYLRMPGGDPLRRIVPFVAGYHGVTPLRAEEVDILFELIQARLCASITILDWRASQERDDDHYLANRVDGEGSAGHFLARLRDVPRGRALATLRAACE
jgi:Ser/Thr protein kinase RdoA (MazF antagonist)